MLMEAYLDGMLCVSPNAGESILTSVQSSLCHPSACADGSRVHSTAFTWDPNASVI